MAQRRVSRRRRGGRGRGELTAVRAGGAQDSRWLRAPSCLLPCPGRSERNTRGSSRSPPVLTARHASGAGTTRSSASCDSASQGTARSRESRVSYESIVCDADNPGGKRRVGEQHTRAVAKCKTSANAHVTCSVRSAEETGAQPMRNHERVAWVPHRRRQADGKDPHSLLSREKLMKRATRLWFTRTGGGACSHGNAQTPPGGGMTLAECLGDLAVPTKEVKMPPCGAQRERRARVSTRSRA